MILSQEFSFSEEFKAFGEDLEGPEPDWKYEVRRRKERKERMEETPTAVYLVAHHEHKAVKIGMGADRVKVHASRGWTILLEVMFPNRGKASKAESTILQTWRDRGIPYGLTAADMPQGGYTETAPSNLVDIEEVMGIISGVLRDKEAIEKVPTVEDECDFCSAVPSDGVKICKWCRCLSVSFNGDLGHPFMKPLALSWRAARDSEARVRDAATNAELNALLGG